MIYSAQEARQRTLTEEEYKQLLLIKKLISDAANEDKRSVVLDFPITDLVRDILDYDGGYGINPSVQHLVKVKITW